MSPVTTASPIGRRRPRLLALAALLSMVALLSACLSPDQSAAIQALNNSRSAHGRPALSTQADAQRKAQAWAERMARDGRISHSTLSSGINVRWCNLGENVGRGSSVGVVQNAFMGSSAHRANVLSRTWNGVGIGVARRGGTVYVAQVYIRTC